MTTARIRVPWRRLELTWFLFKLRARSKARLIAAKTFIMLGLYEAAEAITDRMGREVQALMDVCDAEIARRKRQ